jgi:hypothetical protein
MTEPRNEPAPDTAPAPAPTYWNPPPSAVAETRPPRSARLRSRFAIATLGIAGAISLIAALQDVSGFAIVDRAEAGTLTVAEADAFDAAFGAMGLLQLGSVILCAIAFLAWLSRSVDNVPGLRGGTPVATPAWSIGWWFVPFANLVKPYQVVADLYRRMAPAERIGSGIVLAWWLLWILNNIVTQIAGRLWGGDTIDSLRTGLSLWVASDLGDVVTAALAILIVVRIQDWADAREAAPPGEMAVEPGPKPAVT